MTFLKKSNFLRNSLTNKNKKKKFNSNFQENLFFSDLKTEINGKNISENLFPNNNENKTIIIIGAGIIGLTQSYNLLEKTKSNIILIDKNKKVSSNCSFSNGCYLNIDNNFPSINKNYLLSFIKSMKINKTPNFKIDFYNGIINYKGGFKWSTNALLNLSHNKFLNNANKMKNLQLVMKKEFPELMKAINHKTITKGAFQHYSNKSNFERRKNLLNQVYNSDSNDYQFYEGSSHLLECEKNLVNINEWKKNIISTIFYPNHSVINTRNFNESIKDYCDKNYKQRFKILNETQFEKFIIKDKNIIKGIQTNKGLLLADDIFICGGLNTVEILEFLNLKISLLPIKGFSFTFNFKEKKLNHIHCDQNFLFYSQLEGNQLRISGLGHILGNNIEFDEKVRKFVIQNARNKFGDDFNENEVENWCGLRPCTPDDVPIYGKLNDYNNVYVNFGHAFRGFFGVATSKLLTDQFIGENSYLINHQDYSLDRFNLI